MPTTSEYLPIRAWMLPVLVLLCLADLAYSTCQHYHARLDGDIAVIVVPNPAYQTVMDNPFGIEAVTEGKYYAGSNRFFVHYAMQVYFSQAPVFFGRFTDPIDALYWSSAAFKSMVQLLLLLLLARYAHALVPLRASSYLVLFLVLTPFFQTMGYAHVLGIINASITYVFFYSWPVALLLLFYYPFFESFIRERPPRLGWPGKAGLSLLVVVLPFSGPVCAPVILVVSLLYTVGLLLRFRNQYNLRGIDFRQWLTQQVNPSTIVFFTMISMVALYSMYLGQYNSENAVSTLPLGERYGKVLQGLGSMLTIKLGYPVLLGGLLISWYLVRSLQVKGAAQLRKFLRWAGLFFLVYILLLPLGGYRSYRPYIVRNDTLLPVICGLLILYGSLAFYLLRSLSSLRQKAYAILLLVVALIFTAADGTNFEANADERQGLQLLMGSEADVVVLPQDLLVLSWDELETPEESRWNAMLLRQWGITDTIRLYYNRRE